MYSGLSATATLIGDSKTPEPAQVSLVPTSLTVKFYLLSSINVPATSGTPSPSKSLDQVDFLTPSDDIYSFCNQVRIRTPPASIYSIIHNRYHSINLSIYYNHRISIASTEFYSFHHFSQPTLRPVRRNSLRV